jgi:predicted transcriptional regulator
MSLALELPDDLIETLAQRAAEIVRADRRFLSKEALAEHLGVNVRTIKTWRAQGLPAYCGRPLMFDLRDVEKWLSRRPA